MMEGSGGSATASGDGNSATAKLGSLNGTAVFTQAGTDVTVVVKVAKCSDGTHGIAVRAGFSCDSDALEKEVWDGKRGELRHEGHDDLQQQ